MRIAVNTRLLIKDKLEGIGIFTYETLERMTNRHRDTEFVFIFDRKYDEEFIFSDNITPIVLSPQARHPLLYYIWFEHSLPGLLRRLGADVFLTPDGFMSLRTEVKTVAVIHDLNFEHYPQYMPLFYRKYYRHYFPKFARKADMIATVSEYSKKDIEKTYKISGTKVRVVGNGVSKRYRVLTEEEKIATRERYTGGSDYFIFAGSLNPRKNINGLLRAYGLFRGKHSGCKMLFAGERRWWTSEEERELRETGYSGDVIFTGRAGEEEMVQLIGSSTGLVYPSFYEGFGLPILEGFASGVPVITSDVSSMPEVSGGAALLADPYKPETISRCMEDIYTKEGLRKEMIERGKERLKFYSWESSSDRLWTCIEELTGQQI